MDTAVSPNRTKSGHPGLDYTPFITFERLSMKIELETAQKPLILQLKSRHVAINSTRKDFCVL